MRAGVHCNTLLYMVYFGGQHGWHTDCNAFPNRVAARLRKVTLEPG